MLVFAYGSNLDDAQMRVRCPGAVAVGTAVLPHHALSFGGHSLRWGGAVATVVREHGSQVEGLLYEVHTADMRALDRHEGCPFAYERTEKTVLDAQDRRWRAQLYLQPDDGQQPAAPPPAYFRVLWQAYTRLGFDRGALVVAAGLVP